MGNGSVFMATVGIWPARTLSASVKGCLGAYVKISKSGKENECLFQCIHLRLWCELVVSQLKLRMKGPGQDGPGC